MPADDELKLSAKRISSILWGVMRMNATLGNKTNLDLNFIVEFSRLCNINVNVRGFNLIISVRQSNLIYCTMVPPLILFLQIGTTLNGAPSENRQHETTGMKLIVPL